MGLLCLILSLPAKVSAQPAAHPGDYAWEQKQKVRHELLYGLLVEQADEEDAVLETGISLQYSLLYQLKELFGVGLGTGLQAYNFESGGVFFPLSLEASGSWAKDWSWQPRYHMALGYGFPIHNNDGLDYQGGLFGRASIGWEKSFKKERAGLLVDVGYQLQRSTRVDAPPWTSSRLTQEWTFQRISLRLGIFF